MVIWDFARSVSERAMIPPFSKPDTPSHTPGALTSDDSVWLLVVSSKEQHPAEKLGSELFWA